MLLLVLEYILSQYLHFSTFAGLVTVVSYAYVHKVKYRISLIRPYMRSIYYSISENARTIQGCVLMKSTVNIGTFQTRS